MTLQIVGLKPRALLGFYVARLREHPVQEVLAALGIAVGVALVFAVQVANSSITGSAAQIVDGVTGSATLQLAARSDRGFNQDIATEVEQLPGIRHAAPLLRSNATIVGPSGHASIQFFGATPALAALKGKLTQNFGPGGLQLTGGIAVPGAIAETLGVSSGDHVVLLADGHKRRVRIGAVLSSDSLGALAGSSSALAPLPLVQTLSDRPGRLSHILVEPQPGQEGAVKNELERVAADRLNVTPANAELAILRQAAKPNDQSTSLFAVISAMVGFLFSLNAMLFTVAERRRFVAALRLEGASPKQILAILGFEALALGVSASIAGLLLGELLARVVFGDVPDYLTFAFPVGTQRVVHPWTVALAFSGGVLAALVASLRPAFDLRSSLPPDAVNREGAEPGEAITRRQANTALWIGLALVLLTTLVALAIPMATVVGGVTLALAALLVMPAVFGFVINQLDRLTRTTGRLNMLAVALMELRATTTRSMALAAVAALAVYGSVSIGGARNDLVRGLDRHTREWLSNADIWVTTGGQDLMTNSFDTPTGLGALKRAPGVEALRVHQGGFLDVGSRRIWLIGRPINDRTMIPPSQMLHGNRGDATARLRQGGWATASAAFADEKNLQIGDSFTLPTAAGDTRFRLAAITMNLGWIPGAVTINNRDYARAMGVAVPSAIEVDLAPGVGPVEGKRIVQQALGPASGLRVQTRQEREEQYYVFGRDGVSRLSQIASLLLVAAALAVACALAATLWQRRPRLAALKIQGARRGQLWRAMLFETGLLVTVGCFVGAVLGVYGHLLAGRFLRETTGFAAPFAVGPEQLLIATALVAGVAMLISAVPGYLAANAPIRAGFQE